MIVASITEAKNEFYDYLSKAQEEPVIVECNGLPRAVIVSCEEYERLRAIEAYYWAQRSSERGKAACEGAPAPPDASQPTPALAGDPSDSVKNAG
jgi:prevent-host-death family protein